MNQPKFKVGAIIKVGNKELTIISILEDKIVSFIYILVSIDKQTKYEYIPKRGIYIIK